MAGKWTKAPDYDRPGFGRAVEGVSRALGWTIAGDLPRQTGVNKGSLLQAIKADRRLPDGVRRSVVGVLMAAAEREGLNVGISRDEFLSLAGFEPEHRPGQLSQGQRGWVGGREVDPAYARWMRLGHQARADLDLPRAVEAYRLAERAAERAGRQTEKVLAVAHQAWAWCDLNDLYLAWQLTEVGLQGLGLADAPPESDLPAAELERCLASDSALQAYEVIAKSRGIIWYSNNSFLKAKRSFSASLNIGLVLDNSKIKADALYRIAQNVIEAATQEGETEWRIIKTAPWCRAMIDHGRELVVGARHSRPKSDEEGLAFDWAQEGKALLLLEGAEAATPAFLEAKGLFGERPARITALVAEGRQAIATGDRRRAEAVLLETIDLGWNIHSALQVSRALCSLGHLYLLHPTSRQQVVDACVGALIAWPYPFRTRDFRRAEQLFKRLHASPIDIQRAWERNSFPLDVVGTLGHVNLARVQRVKEHLERVINGQPRLT